MVNCLKSKKHTDCPKINLNYGSDMDQCLISQPNLLLKGDPTPFEVFTSRSTNPLLILCDHASPIIPSSLADLGLEKKDLERHIAYDIGARAIAKRLSENLNATCIASSYSRLVIDINRPLNHKDSIIKTIDKTLIPGNKTLTKTARRTRIKEVFLPYHRKVKQELTRLQKTGAIPIILSIHSFSPRYGKTPRPWDIGILWNRDNRLAMPLINTLKSGNLIVGDNQPYSGKELAYTIDTHGTSAGLANCVIEINQNQISDPAGIKQWSEILIKILPGILQLQELRCIKFF